MQTTCHIQRLPLRAEPDLPAPRAAERPPVLARLLRREEVREADGHVADDGVLEEVAVVDDLGDDHARRLVRAEELGAVLPDGVVRVLDLARDVERVVGG